MTVLRSISSYVETGGVTTLCVKFVLIFFLSKQKCCLQTEKDSAKFGKKTVLLLKKNSVTIDKFKWKFVVRNEN